MARDVERCPNNNHGRANVPVRYCPLCGQIVNPRVASKLCSEEEHAQSRRRRHDYCVLLVDHRVCDFAWATVGVFLGVGAQLLTMKLLGGEWFSVSSLVKSEAIGLPLSPFLGGLPPYPGRFLLLSMLLPSSALAGSVSFCVQNRLREKSGHGKG